jgi:hypothetical protein
MQTSSRKLKRIRLRRTEEGGGVRGQPGESSCEEHVSTQREDVAAATGHGKRKYICKDAEGAVYVSME